MLPTSSAASDDISRPVPEMRDAAKARGSIDALVQARMKMYGSDEARNPSSFAASPPPTQPSSLSKVPGLTVTTQFLVIVRDDVPQCKEITQMLKTHFPNDSRFLVKDVTEVREHLAWLRGIPTLVSVDEERIYEGSAVKQLLTHMSTSNSGRARTGEGTKNNYNNNNNNGGGTAGDTVSSTSSSSPNDVRPLSDTTSHREYASGTHANIQSIGRTQSSSRSSSLAQLYGKSFKTDMSKYTG
jgi:hypothetical protein